MPDHLCRFPVRATRAGAYRLFSGAATRVGLARRLGPGYSVTPPRFRGSVPASHARRRRNLDLLSIGFAIRLILRPRLTLIRIALIRNPWSFGGGASHAPFRYSFLHLPFRTLQTASTPSFAATGMLPYRPFYRVPLLRRAAYARLLSTPGRSTGELLRTPWMNGCFQANIPAVHAARLR